MTQRLKIWISLIGIALSSMALADVKDPTKHTRLLLDVSCNNGKREIVFALQDNENKLWIKEEIFQICQLPKADIAKQLYQNEWYYALDQISRTTYQYNPSELSLDIQIPSLLKSQYIDLNRPTNGFIRPEHPGGYVNYDLTYQQGDQINTQVGGLIDLVYFNFYGVGNSEFLFRKGNDTQTLTRLNTAWTLDKPEKMTTLRWGDSITGTAIWTSAVQFGGVQFARNFATQPGFISYPLPALRGQAVVPSTVEFYLNNQLQTEQPLANGPFEIQGLPAMTGAGDLVVQTKDILGRQTVAVLPFYVSQQFLSPGLTSFSYEAGMIRQNFGLESNDYRHGLAVGSFQKGLTPTWTAGWHAELQGSQQTVGINSGHIIQNLFEIDLATAMSQSHSEIGALFLLGLQRRTQNYSFGARAITTTENFQQLGIQPGALAPQLLLQSNAGISTPWGGFSVSYTDRVGRTEPTIGVFTASYSKTLFHQLALVVNYLHQTGQVESNLGYIALIWSPAPRYTASLSYEHGDDTFQNGATASFTKNLPTDTGYGYRIIGSTGKYPTAEIDLSAQNDHGLYRASYSHFAGNNYFELDVSGAWVQFADQYFLTRPIDSSFVLVQVPDQPDVRVYWSNQLIGKTDQNGYIFIPQTIPYDENLISIQPEDIQLNHFIGKDKLIAKPYYQAGTLLTFPIERVYNVTFHLRYQGKEFVPPGATVLLDHGDRYPVGYEGKVFVSHSQVTPLLSGTAHWADRSCRFSVSLPAQDQLITPLGNVVCTKK